MPQAAGATSGVTVGFKVADGIGDLNYTAGCTSYCVQWAPVPDQSSGAHRRFTIPVTPGVKGFISLRVSPSAP